MSDLPAMLRAYLSSIGRRGGAAGTGKAKARTSEQARAAAKARWEKRRKGSKKV